MKYRRLGKTNLRVSVVGIGTWQFSGSWGKEYNQAEVDAILDQAREVGINMVDTAECYGHHLSESFIGNYLSSRKNRNDWIIATKFGHNHLDRQKPTKNYWSAEEVLKQLDASLKALNTDYVDLYQFHSGSDVYFNNDDLWTALDKQVQAGKVRNLGISIAKNNDIYQTESSTRVGSKVIQVVYNRLDQAPELEVLPSCIKQDLGVLARVPLASGFLSGKYKPGAVFHDNDVRSKRDQEQSQQRLEMVERISRTEVPHGVEMATWALAWCLKHPAISCVIPGCKSPEQVLMNAAAADLDDVQENHRCAWKQE